jgi:hypothetical protein
MADHAVGVPEDTMWVEAGRHGRRCSLLVIGSACGRGEGVGDQEVAVTHDGGVACAGRAEI